jgi:ABC-type multidrug transport system ATPase subunit
MTPIVAFRSVGKRFPGVVALDDVSFELAAGECHAICGENGAGKSTLMKVLSGVITDYEGDLFVRGDRVRFRGTQDAEAAGIADACAFIDAGRIVEQGPGAQLLAAPQTTITRSLVAACPRLPQG